MYMFIVYMYFLILFAVTLINHHFVCVIVEIGGHGMSVYWF